MSKACVGLSAAKRVAARRAKGRLDINYNHGLGMFRFLWLVATAQIGPK
jgi:hypothetical protein